MKIVKQAIKKSLNLGKTWVSTRTDRTSLAKIAEKSKQMEQKQKEGVKIKSEESCQPKFSL